MQVGSHELMKALSGSQTRWTSTNNQDIDRAVPISYVLKGMVRGNTYMSDFVIV